MNQANLNQRICGHQNIPNKVNSLTQLAQLQKSDVIFRSDSTLTENSGIRNGFKNSIIMVVEHLSVTKNTLRNNPF